MPRSPRRRSSLFAALALTGAAVGASSPARAQQAAPSAAPTPSAAPAPAPNAAPARSSGRGAAPPVELRAQTAGTLLRLTLPGEWQVRGHAMTDLPLATTPGEREPAALGQNQYLEQWFRFRPLLTVGDRFRVVGQLDVARGIILGQSTRQVSLSRDARSTELSPFATSVVDLRTLYLDWRSPIGVLRAGQQGSHWGLGIVANDGDHPQTFGDYRMGDLVERIAFATRPGGERSNVVLAIAGDLVYRDRLTRLVEYRVPVEGLPRGPNGEPGSRALGNDRAWQAIASVFYQRHDCVGDECERHRVGAYLVYRDQHNQVGNPELRDDYLRVLFADLYGRWEWPTPDNRARVWAALELAAVAGRTSITRNVQFSEHEVLQFGGAMELGIYREGSYRLTLEAGYASGDGNPVDGAQTRFTFNPDRRVGLLLFPELIAWQTARSAAIATDPRIVGRPTRGAELLPSSGGVTNAMYLYPTAVVHLHRLLELRTGAVLAQSTSDVVDPVQVISYGVARNYRGGDARFRDLGLELDLGLMARVPIAAGIVLHGGAQGAVLFPGRAFADAAGVPMGVLGTAQGRLGLTF